MGKSDEGAVSVAALQLALDILGECCREPLHGRPDAVFESFRDTASRLERDLAASDPILPQAYQEDLRRIATIFRSVGE